MLGFPAGAGAETRWAIEKEASVFDLSKQRGIRVLALLAAFALALTACGGNDDTASGEGEASEGEASESDELVEFTIAASLVNEIPYITMLQIAIDKGWFEEEGLDAELLSAGGGGDTVRLLTAGEADLALSGPDGILAAAEAEGSNIQVISGWFGINIVVWVTDEPDRDLQGARLGVTGAGSTGELMARTIQALHPELDLEIVVVGGLGDNFTAMQAGQIEGAYSAAPFATQQIREQGAHPLLPARDYIGDVPTNLAAVNEDYAAENPEAVRAFWRVAERAYTYLREDTAAAVDDLAEYIQMDREILLESMESTPRFEEAWTIAIPCDSYENLSRQFELSGVVEEPVDWGEVIDQQYLPEDVRCEF
jgi:NitT/TauT family transport system substrate-binding protein